MVAEAWGAWVLATAAEAGAIGLAALAADAGLRRLGLRPPARWSAALAFLALLGFLAPALVGLDLGRATVAPYLGAAEGAAARGLLPWLAAMQVAGLTVGLALLTRSAGRLRSTLRRSRRVEGGPLMEILRDVSRHVGIPTPPLYVTDHGPPAAAGVRRPVILLPSALLGLEDDRLRMVLMHEAAHVARRDPLAAAIRTLALSLWWGHPVAWALASRHRTAVEDACDDAVLGTARPADYCAAILACAATVTGGGASTPWGRSPGVALGGHPLERRFRRIHRPAARSGPRGTRGRPALSALLIAVALAGPVRFVALDQAPTRADEVIAIRQVITAVRIPGALPE